MITLLGYLLDGVELIGTLALWAIETACNGFFVALVAAWTAVASALPGMSDAPAIGTPTWLGWLNWVYPVTDLLAGLATIVALWVSFLVFRFLLRLVRAI